MKEIFEMRAMELANRHLLRKRTHTRSFVIAPGAEVTWAFPRESFFRILECDTLECPPGVTWQGFACSSLLNFNALVYPVLDWFALTGTLAEDRTVPVFALSAEPRVALTLPRSTSIRDLDTSKLQPTDRRFANGTIEGIWIVDWSALS